MSFRPRCSYSICILFILINSIHTVTSDDCKDLSGEWKNTKGSVLKLEQRGHTLHGTFSSAVEVKKGSAGDGAVHIKGFVHDGLVSYAVKYPSSMAAFTGQCYQVDGKETIFVSWILHSKQEECEDNWLATRMGQDKFVRRHQFVTSSNNAI